MGVDRNANRKEVKAVGWLKVEWKERDGMERGNWAEGRGGLAPLKLLIGSTYATDRDW